MVIIWTKVTSLTYNPILLEDCGTIIGNRTILMCETVCTGISRALTYNDCGDALPDRWWGKLQRLRITEYYRSHGVHRLTGAECWDSIMCPLTLIEHNDQQPGFHLFALIPQTFVHFSIELVHIAHGKGTCVRCCHCFHVVGIASQAVDFLILNFIRMIACSNCLKLGLVKTNLGFS